MQTLDQTAPISKTRLWAARIVTTIAALFLLLDGIMKVLKAPQAIEGSVQLGFTESSVVALGIILILCVILYLVPRTAVLGAVLLTGYLGGATATHVRVEDNFAGPVIVGVLVWLGLYLRDPRLRALLPLRSPLLRKTEDSSR